MVFSVQDTGQTNGDGIQPVHSFHEHSLTTGNSLNTIIYDNIKGETLIVARVPLRDQSTGVKAVQTSQIFRFIGKWFEEEAFLMN